MSTSKLQNYTGKRIKKFFGDYEIEENAHPDWLISSNGGRMELDFFISELSIAIEVQGKQHLEFVPFFHEHEHNFAMQQLRDREKRGLCRKAGIKLFYVYNRDDVGAVIASIQTESTYISSQRRKNKVPIEQLAKNKDRFKYHLDRVCSVMSSIESGRILKDKSRKKLGESLNIVITGIDQCGLEITGPEIRHPRKMELIDMAIEYLAVNHE